jgi:hypothetical protein
MQFLSRADVQIIAAEPTGTIRIEEECLAIPRQRRRRIVRGSIQNGIASFLRNVIVNVYRNRPIVPHGLASRHPEIKTAYSAGARAGNYHLQAIPVSDCGARVAKWAAEFGIVRSRAPQSLTIAPVNVGKASTDVNVESVSGRI